MTASDKEMRDPRRDEVIAGEYVLGVLSAEDRRKVEARLAKDRQFAAMVNRWEENLSTFNDDYEALQPPPRAFSAIEQRILGPASPPDAAFAGNVAGGFWNSLALWRALAFASLAVAAGLAFSMSTLLAPRPVSGGRLVADLSGEGAAINLVARYDEANGALRVTPVAAGKEKEKSLELWLVEDGKSPVSLGVLPQTGEGELAVPEQMRGRLVQGAVLAVSVEPFGGSPTGSATGPVIASGAARFD
ncbi:anti-sigma factor [Shinella zoogloeoides]|jgi:anti-sigma-K factor RskA|uniref:anti-sigma factor n=1 Tax=Shinella zoogloeoides TaxID=352475 RepID=UPI00273FD08B|nr:anti-sigma factor [Shinella zoogloeoides]WLR92859.1 anti-sigma factor [Shinella zoogloeoides]